MPKRENEYKAAKLLEHEGEFFPFTVHNITFEISKFKNIDPQTQEELPQKHQLAFTFRTESDGEIQEIKEWSGNNIPMREFHERNKLGKIATAFGVINELIKDWKGFDIESPEEIAAVLSLFKGKTAEGLIKIRQRPDALPIVKIETWRACKTPVEVNGKKKAKF